MFEEGDALTRPILGWEIERRLTEVKSTCLAVRYLLPRDEADREDAFDGLIAICFRVKRNLFVVDEDSKNCEFARAGAEGDNLFWATRKFIVEVVCRFLLPYTTKQSTEIIKAALEGKFRYIPRIVRLRLIDKVRAWKRRKKTVWHETLSLSFPMGNEDDDKEEFGDGVAFNVDRQGPSRNLNSTLTRPGQWNLPEICAVFRDLEPKYRPLLGERGWEVLLCFADTADHKTKNKREQKGRITRLITERRGVNERQARSDKHFLKKRLKEIAHATEPHPFDDEERRVRHRGHVGFT